MNWNDLIQGGIKLMDCLKAFNYSCFLLQTFWAVINWYKKIASQNLLDIQNQGLTRLLVNHYSLVTVLLMIVTISRWRCLFNVVTQLKTPTFVSFAWVWLLHIIFHTAPSLHHSNPWTAVSNLNQFPFFYFENLLKKTPFEGGKKKVSLPWK